jgi:hypothetical protein
VSSRIHQSTDLTCSVQIEKLHSRVIILQALDVVLDVLQLLLNGQTSIGRNMVRWIGGAYLRVTGDSITNGLDFECIYQREKVSILRIFARSEVSFLFSLSRAD